MIFRIDKDTELTPSLLAEYIGKAKKENGKRNIPLLKAYKGDYPVLHQRNKPAYKPDNRLAVNFAKYIVDTFNGFFIGNPIKTTTDDPKAAETLEAIQSRNDQDDNNAELAKMMSIFGRGYEMYYVTESKDIGITYVSPIESFMIYSDSITEEPLYFVRFHRNAEGDEVGSVSDSRMVYNFKFAGGNYILDEGVLHGFDGVPATEFIENEERIGLFEPVMTLINAYNKALSEKANDVDYFADAYLKILGAKLEPEDLKDLRTQRIINLDGNGQEDLVVDFMAKPNADATQENLLTTLERLIYQVAMVPNINDESFGTSSGIAMQYKLLNTHNLFRAKQRKFESGMNRRWKLIFSNPVLYGSVKPEDWQHIRYRFTPNIPANVLEEAQTAAQLQGIVSQQTQLETLSIVSNVQEEMERIEQEQNSVIQTDGYDFDAHDHEETDLNGD